MKKETNYSGTQYLGRIFLALLFVIGLNFNSEACSPLAVPSLLSQNISGGNLNLSWQSNTTYNCTYSVQVELACNGSAFTGTNPLTLFMSPQLVKPGSAPAPFPLQSINISNLCPGTVYQFRAREVYAGSTYSGWTSTYTFTTPGTFTPPTVNIAATSNTICPPQTSTLNATISNTCGLGAPTYSWMPSLGLSCTTCSNPIASPSVSTNYTCIVTGGLLGCWTSSSVVSINISSGSAILTTSATQGNCTNPIPTATLIPAGSASVQTSITWSPAPGSVSGNSLVATNLPVGITTITVFDGSGCQATTTLNILPPPPPVTFTVNNATGSNSITCTYPTINMNATTNYTYGSMSYTWTSVSFSATGNSVNLNTQGSYQVCGMDPATTCSLCQTFTIGLNTTPPTTSVNPTSQVITCSLSGTATFTSTSISPTTNIVHNWYTPLSPPPIGPSSFSSNNQICPYVASAGPGTYSVIVTDLVNGCSTTKTVNITSLAAYPSFGISSPTNFTLGCSPSHNTTTLSIINPTTTGGVQYAFLPPTFTGTNVTFSGISSTVTTLPGTWTLVVNDPNNSCTTALPVIVLQNTVGPHVDVSLLTQTLTCFNPTVLATGTSTTPFTQIVWNVPSVPPTLSTPSVIVGPPTGPPTSTNSLTYANYTVVATNTVNGCVTTSLVVINQNFKAPNPILAAAGNPSVINCNGVPVTISFTNSAITSSITGAIATVQSWFGPSPQVSVAATPAYSAYVAGVYTVNVQDSKNGCVGTRTINIVDKTQPPVLNSVSIVTLDCASNSAALMPSVVGGNSGHLFWFPYYPHGASFNPLGAITNPGTTSSTISVDMPGTYSCVVTNTSTGCAATVTFEVVGGDLNADFTPDPVSGYAPLSVNFTNNSASSLGSSGITSVWSFGNGSTQTTTSNINTTAVYQAAGSYTVMLIAAKGACVDTAYKVIKIDVPSKLEVPNVFTPNGDGSNDVFFLKTQNLTEINCLIFDRWGNKVYEVTSTTGNVAWDGKNFEGKECAPGVYFYLIKATGKDTKTYDQKGNVSLYR